MLFWQVPKEPMMSKYRYAGHTVLRLTATDPDRLRISDTDLDMDSTPPTPRGKQRPPRRYAGALLTSGVMLRLSHFVTIQASAEPAVGGLPDRQVVRK